jgi:rhamnopyranosyl-N-acetylglucosaminyl-diphospho-decaprenol beta-1,3/1,4-galactofuranosyltransferase
MRVHHAGKKNFKFSTQLFERYEMSCIVFAVVVTFNRKDLLRECLDALLAQTRPLDSILVVDNASNDGTREMLESRYAGKVNRIQMVHNVGGAGGFYRGLRWAHGHGAEWIWLMDDDGLPAPDALEQLLAAEFVEKYDVLNSLVVARDDPKKLSFGFWMPPGRVSDVDELKAMIGGGKAIESQINPFNGTLISRRAVDNVGYVRPEMFIWGDEEDFNMRVQKSGLSFATILAARHCHPRCKKNEVKIPILGSFVIAPAFAANIHARNMGYLARRYRQPLYWVAKLAAYVLYFILQMQFLTALNFARYWIDGARDRFGLPPSRKELTQNVGNFSFLPKKNNA